MPEKIDILIKNGSVIEPDKKTICKKNIAIRDGYVVDYDKTINYEIKDEINFHRVEEWKLAKFNDIEYIKEIVNRN